MKIKKIIKLINDERLKTTAMSGKSCDSGSTDHCYSQDQSECVIHSIDICVVKDSAGCYIGSEDVCAQVEDTYACHGGQVDYT